MSLWRSVTATELDFFFVINELSLPVKENNKLGFHECLPATDRGKNQTPDYTLQASTVSSTKIRIGYSHNIYVHPGLVLDLDSHKGPQPHTMTDKGIRTAGIREEWGEASPHC